MVIIFLHLKMKNFDLAHQKWKELADKWVKCLHEKLPFILESPIVTAFDPTFVYEIIVKPQTVSSNLESSVNNPYTKDMLANGFTNTFAKNSLNSNGLLDRGYNNL